MRGMSPPLGNGLGVGNDLCLVALCVCVGCASKGKSHSKEIRLLWRLLGAHISHSQRLVSSNLVCLVCSSISLEAPSCTTTGRLHYIPTTQTPDPWNESRWFISDYVYACLYMSQCLSLWVSEMMRRRKDQTRWVFAVVCLLSRMSGRDKAVWVWERGEWVCS